MKQLNAVGVVLFLAGLATVLSLLLHWNEIVSH